MEINQSTPTNNTPNLSTQPKAEISSGFETFLRMLTVQMQNQDPLNPVDSSDYAVQLATFSGVEQAVQTNDLLRTLTTQMGVSGISDMAEWVGKEARATSPAYFDGQPITLFPNPASIADKAEIIVKDQTGQEVQRFDIPISDEPVTWAGVGDGGFPFAQGLYQFEVASIQAGEVIATSQAQTYSTVTEVQIKNGQSILILQGGTEVSASDVTALRNPQN